MSKGSRKQRPKARAGSRMEPDSNLPRPQLTDEQWALISDLFPVPTPDPRGGRPRADVRHCLEGVLWVLRSGARWKDLPGRSRRTLPAGGASSSGQATACGTKPGAD